MGDPPPAQLTEAQKRPLAQYFAHAPPRRLIPLDAHFDDGIKLSGYTLQPRRPQYAPGSSLRLTLVWKLTKKPSMSWRVFSRLKSPSGRLLSNLESSGPLRAMAGVQGVPLPPFQWPVGKWIHDELRITLPADAPERLHLVSGFYGQGKRLSGRGKDMNPHGTAARITLRMGRSHPLPELTIPRRPASKAVHIDGVIDEAAWAQAASTGAFVHPRTGEAQPLSPVQGRAKLLYDDDYLYTAFNIKDPTLSGSFPPETPNPHLWESDTVEIMIDPDGEGDNRDYYEIQIGPQNLVFDSRFDDYNRPRGGPNKPFGHEDWSSQLHSAVSLRGTLNNDRDRDEGYIVEARIPWRAFSKAQRSPPRRGDRWRMNFYAIQKNSGLAWSPILGQGNFHRASRFGRVTFGD